jgi:hypothetical protein
MLRKRRDGYIRRNVGRNDGEKILSNFNPGKVNNPALRDAIKLILLESEQKKSAPQKDECFDNMTNIIEKIYMTNIEFYEDLSKRDFDSELSKEEFESKLNKIKSRGYSSKVSFSDFTETNFEIEKDEIKNLLNTLYAFKNDILVILEILKRMIDGKQTKEDLADFKQMKKVVMKISPFVKIPFVLGSLANELSTIEKLAAKDKKSLCEYINKKSTINFKRNLISDNYYICHEFSNLIPRSFQPPPPETPPPPPMPIRQRLNASRYSIQEKTANKRETVDLAETNTEEVDNKKTVELLADGRKRSKRTKKLKKSDGRRSKKSKKTKKSDGRRSKKSKKTKKSDGRRSKKSKKTKKSDGRRSKKSKTKKSKKSRRWM